MTDTDSNNTIQNQDNTNQNNTIQNQDNTNQNNINLFPWKNIVNEPNYNVVEIPEGTFIHVDKQITTNLVDFYNDLNGNNNKTLKNISDELEKNNKTLYNTKIYINEEKFTITIIGTLYTKNINNNGSKENNGSNSRTLEKKVEEVKKLNEEIKNDSNYIPFLEGLIKSIPVVLNNQENTEENIDIKNDEKAKVLEICNNDKVNLNEIIEKIIYENKLRDYIKIIIMEIFINKFKDKIKDNNPFFKKGNSFFNKGGSKKFYKNKTKKTKNYHNVSLKR